MNMNTVNEILNDPSTHNWIKNQYRVRECSDIVDALNDAELLVEMLKTRFNYMIGKGK